MKFYPTAPSKSFIGFVCIFLLIIISCSKDSELLKDAVLADPSTEIKEDTKETSEEITEEELVPEEAVLPEEEEIVEEKVYETRTTVFTPIHDAHLQSGKGYNQDLIRLDEGHRESYLMFDISPIDSIGGILEEAHLEFTISTDDGHGTISVLKGDSTDWSEHDISEITAPKSDTILGSTTDDYHVNQTQEIILDQEKLNPEVLTLVLKHEDGNDLAFASKEHSSKNGPKLVITYSAPQDSEGIVSADQNPTTEAPSAPSIDDEDSPVSETPEEPTNQEEEEEEEEEEETPSNDTPEVIEEEEPDTPISTENQSPIAVVDASPSSGTAPLKVNFTGNNSSDDEEVKNYGWNFGDGSSSNEANPSHTFEKAGTFKVVLTVQDAQGKIDTEETTITVKTKENNAPTAVAKASVTSGEAPLKVTFDGKESSDDIGVTNYLWDFKDGDKGSSSSTSHTFTKAGTYEVVLTVKDKDGLENTDTVTITVTEKENKAPTAKASANTTEGEAPLDIQFKGSNSTDDTAVKNYFWDFKDGSTSTSSNPSHSFTKKGTYNVTLTVTDEDGLKDSKTITITITEIENEAPVAVASGSPLTGYAPLNVQFSSNNSTDDKEVTGYFWDFKDGSTTTNKNPSHSFSEPGTYKVELSVKDKEGLTHLTTVEVKVNERPVDNSGGNTGGGDTGSGGSTGGGSTGGGSSSGGSSGNYPSNAVYASSFGFKSGDATAAFEAALNSGNSYVVIDKQSSDWIIKPTRFFDLTNMTIVFEAGVTLRAKSGAFTSSSAILFELYRPKNVIIEGNGATFKMNKSEYNSGESRHALSIRQGNNITIKDLTFRDSGGDGIYIAGGNSLNYSKDITIDNVICDNNRRQGMSIISAQNVYVKNSTFKNTSGADPESGVDLEPNNSDERLVNINFSNCTFSKNDSFGVLVSTGKLNSSSTPISVTVKNSEFSYNGDSPSSGIVNSEIRLSQGITTNPVKGEVRFENIYFNGSNNRIIMYRNAADAYNVIFKNCTAKNVAKQENRGVIELQALSIENTIGGITFDNFKLEYTNNVPFLRIEAPSSGTTLKNVSGNFIIDEPYNNPIIYSGGYKKSKNVNVNINYQHIN
ncbi:PKD domain-containing protein [Zobellia sp. 1_MG-2023]|uniref:PKD domain-containing protein n=1 Tax=Zobellia sp. 1_MG-2023 TaxID=3062626 RepID=UPI0026E26BE6|nr:PKD domain-containing protein [Zobellia sp. 1_MG-2023]MDO6819746.1 PKD domain-containing protein [Zobellia sp. 1_MG-2023]